MSDFYGVLGVSKRADGAQIKFAYRKLAKRCHPDLHGGDKRAELRFKELSRAYETLSKPEARAEYDEARARVLRRRARSVAATMSASFVFTVSSGLLVAMWLRDGLF